MSEENVSHAKNNIRLLLIAVPLLFLLIAGSIFFMFPVGQKLLGKSFVVTSANGYEIIYKGQTLMIAPPNCVVQYSDDFSQIDVTCKDKSHNTWANGELVKTSQAKLDPCPPSTTIHGKEYKLDYSEISGKCEGVEVKK